MKPPLSETVRTGRVDTSQLTRIVSHVAAHFLPTARPSHTLSHPTVVERLSAPAANFNDKGMVRHGIAPVAPHVNVASNFARGVLWHSVSYIEHA